MEAEKQDALLREATLQLKMVKNLECWFRLLIAMSGIGIVLVWWSFQTSPGKIVSGISGGVVATAAFVAALLVRRGIVNGRKNVAKILGLVEKGKQ
ncbi:hypothetical protein Ga0466249_002486 [Sporomusaceae bacterium BoRhaA]|uniref:hypothetical protein n=1 Tax=Pelorhabdus rhamnosifermentans TaxID=2772457 RepID=UPI001C06126F|nr:hypothetical protein [Pelorhabdus rhamnosifermentans]MBU2701372.1 hypothetical protein [Pelorhabdus rhamnosifermentans]